ncbi:MAG: ABC transporter permease [Solirubrobacteraceae bacterium]
MRLSTIRVVNETRLESRAVLVQELFAILGIAVGVALLFASQISSASLAHSVTPLNTQLIGGTQEQLVARGPEGVPEGLLVAVRHLHRVGISLPILERQINVIGPHGTRSVELLGIEPRAIRASGPLLERFSAKKLVGKQAVALPAFIANEVRSGPLEEVKLQFGARFINTLVSTTLGEKDIGTLAHSPIALTTLGYAQTLSGTPGRITKILVRLHPTTAASERTALARLAAKWHVNLEPGNEDASLFRLAVEPETKSEQLFSAISALVGFMFALNAMLVTVQSRRRLIRDLRAHGATTWMTVQILLFDAIILGVVACALGLVLGDLLSIMVFHETPGYLLFAFPVGNTRIVTGQSIAIAVGAGMTAAIVGVFWPVQQVLAAPLRPLNRPEAHSATWVRARLAAGFVSLAITTTVLVARVQAGIIGNIALLGALVCLLPFLFDVVVYLAGRVSDRFGRIAVALSATELKNPQTRGRSIAIATTAALAVFSITEFQGTQSNLRSGLESSIRAMDSSASLWIVPRGPSSLQTTQAFEPQQATALRLARVPGVANLGLYRGSFLNWGNRRLWIIAPPSSARQPFPASQTLGGDVSAAEARVRKGGWAVVSRALAVEHRLSIGARFTMPSPRPESLRVAGITTNLGWPPGAVVISSTDFADGWQSRNPSAYEVALATHAPPVSVMRARIQAALGGASGLKVETAHEREKQHYAAAKQGLSRLTQIRLLVLIAATLAIVVAMGSMIWERREKIAALKCHGFREGVLWRWLIWETALLLVTGSAIGAAFGLYAQILGSRFLATVTGFPMLYGLEGAAGASSCALITLVAVAMLAIPGYRAVRVPPSAASSSL